MKIAPTFHSLTRIATRISLLATFGALALLGGACGSDSNGSNPDGGGGGGTDPAKYGFETDIQGWTTPDPAVVTALTTSSAQKSGGNKSLEVTFAPTAGSDSIAYTIEIAFMGTLPTIMPLTNATFHVYVGAGVPVSAIQPFINESDMSPGQPYRWTGKWTAAMAGTWQTIEVPAPMDVTGLQKVGVQLFASAAGSGPVYIDSVDWK